MHRRAFLQRSLGALAGAAALGSVSFAQAARRPNFVFFLVDDLGWTDLGCFGSSFYETPNVDRLAAQGVKFTNAYAACPVCSPTRASIMAGKYPARMNTTDYFGAPQPYRMGKHWTRDKPLLPAAYEEQLPHEEVTIAEALKESGYATFFAGKWHLGGEGFWPESQGFDVNKGGWTRGGPYGGKKYFSPYGNPRLEDGPEGEHLPDRLATEAAKFIASHKDRPFLTYVSFYSVHTPLIARKDLQRKYREKGRGIENEWREIGDRRWRAVQNHAVYGGMVEAMDQAVGKVLAALETEGVAGNTIVIFMSDNGGLSTSEGHPTTNLPLRAGKGWMYEGGIREPMIVKWPGVSEAGTTCETPVISTDFYPTMLDMAGLPPRPEQHVDGVSFAPLFKGGALAERALFWHYPHYGNQGGSPSAAVRLGDWKLIEFFEDKHVELYNLADDIGEERDLAEGMPGKIKALASMLHAWQKDVDARFPTPNPKAREL
ncbi:MAG: sulfatase-like hydrolase/transferase [Nitrospiraceae bacterium]|nr:sulfatase-like hydrolase/transferase [Nitrospiraceae bacterium]